MTAGEQVAFKPSLAEVFAQHFHDAAVRAKLIVDRNKFSHRATLGGLEDGVKTVGIRFIGAEHTKVLRIHFENVPKEISKLAWRLGKNLTGAGDFEGVVGKIGQSQGDQLASPIHMGISAHASIAHRGESRQFVNELAVLVEEFLWLVASHPGFKDLEMLGVFTLSITHNSGRVWLVIDGSYSASSQILTL